MKLFNSSKVELHPFGLTNCGNRYVELSRDCLLIILYLDHPFNIFIRF